VYGFPARPGSGTTAPTWPGRPPASSDSPPPVLLSHRPLGPHNRGDITRPRDFRPGGRGGKPTARSRPTA
jgi:hypothetical protein